MENNEPKDQQLWRMAKKRAGFKRHFAVYAIINLFLWAKWFLFMGAEGHERKWPMYVTLGWGLAVALHFINAYYFSTQDLSQREYEKLKKKE